MKNRLFMIVLSAIILCQQHVTLSGGSEKVQQCGRTDERLEPTDLNNDFENDTSSPCWIDESKSDVRWRVEHFDSSWEPDCKAPAPVKGRSYLRVDRGSVLSFGVAVLRSLTFTMPPDDYDIYISFSFWIRSKWPRFTNLELYLVENGQEKLLTSLFNYSDITNQEWRTESIPINQKLTWSEFSLIFYAYCGTDVEDAVTIDNISLTSQPSSPRATDTTTTTPPTTTKKSTATTTTSKIASTTTPTTTSKITTTTPTTTSKTTTTATTTSTTTSKTTTTTPTTTSKTTTTTATTTTTSPDPTTTVYPCSRTNIVAELPESLSTISFVCPDSSHKFYPKGNCSRQYYECIDCQAKCMNCQQNKVFSYAIQDCDNCNKLIECQDQKCNQETCSSSNRIF